MAQRFAGIAFLSVDGNQLALRGNFTVSPSAVERTMIAGQDGVHGYQELPRVPYIEADLSTVPGLSLEALLTETDSTVIAQLANNMQYTLSNATCRGGLEENTRDGQVRVRWEGLICDELALG
jgi:Phage tail tube protein